MDNKDDLVIYKLKTPITTSDGEEITEIAMNLSDLSTPDLEKCERQANAFLGKKGAGGLIDLKKTYAAFVAAKASGLHHEDIRALKGRDYTQLCFTVQDFLLGGESEDLEEDEMENPKSNRANGRIPTLGTTKEKSEKTGTLATT